MLKSWSIQNFKPILNSGELKLAPVTVLAGRNSSGKSSLIQSILMIAQTLSSRVLDRPLLSHGPFARLGTFADILNKYSGRSSLIIEFQLDMEREAVVPNKRPVRVSRGGRGGRILETDIQFVKVVSEFIGEKTNQPNISAIEASKVNIERVLMEVVVSGYEFAYDETAKSRLIRSEKPIAFEFNIQRMTDRELEDFLSNVAPESLRLVPYSSGEANYLGTFQSEDQSATNDVPDPSLVAFSHFLPSRLTTKFEVEGSEALGTMPDIVYAEQVGQAVKEIEKFFTTKIRYLGPLRADPEIIQGFPSSNEVDDIGSKGQYAATVYDANQKAKIRWYDPINQKIEQSELKIALDTWARYLDVAYQVQTEIAGQSGVSWQIVHRDGHQPLPLSAVGVGISQILPILVMGLLAPSHTLLLVEQPELHLHPSVQARLGDFFLGLAKCDKQCLIETHSENLVNQLRYHIVQANGQDKSDCLIYFVDQDELGAAKFEPIEISPQGNILNWPAGFFDETILQEGRINTESLRKRAKKANNG